MKREEAINIVRNIYQTDAEKEALQTLIPELRESGEERTRKELVNFLQSPFIKENLTDEKVAPWIAYLEKQKAARDESNNENEDERIRLFICDFITHIAWRKDWDISKEDCLAYLEKQKEQKEQKPAEWSKEDENKIESIKALITTGKFADTNTIRTIWELLDSLNPQPKQEWSEEDEKIRNAILGFLNPNKGGTKYSSNAELVWWSNWLKSLPERFNLPSKQECDEEDEKKIHFLSRLIELQVKDDEYCFGDGRLISKQEAIEMLKSLRHSWKPSEEQMKALINCVIGNEYDVHALARLFADLKKL